MMAVMALLLAGFQAQAQDLDLSKLVGTFQFENSTTQDSDGMEMTMVFKGALTLNADQSALREGTLDLLMPIDDGSGYANTFIMSFTFKSIDETWKVEDGKLTCSIPKMDVQFVSARAEKDDLIAGMFLNELNSQGPDMADGLKNAVLGDSTETIKSIDDNQFVLVSNNEEETVYTRK